MKNIVFAALLSMILTGCLDRESKIVSQTVMITNLAKNSGGSGTIVEHNSYSSKILTNGHVCEVARKGGLVHTSDKITHLVVNFTKSKIHDLCLIEVQEDLGVAAELKDFAPVTFDDATVSGHPKLAPTTVTHGQFGSKEIISVVMGFRDCNQADAANPDTGLMCMIIGKVLLIKNFEAIFVSALIQPGSSGSGVYDLWGKIGAVIFAGQGDLGFGYAVPYEYVYAFLFHEFTRLTTEFPDSNALSDAESEKATTQEFKKVCTDILGNDKTPGQVRICNQVDKHLKHLGGFDNVLF